MGAAQFLHAQWQAAHFAQRKAQNAAKAAKRALAKLQKMHEDTCVGHGMVQTKSYFL